MLLKKRNHIIALLQVFLVICTFSSCIDDGSLEKSCLSVSDKATGYLAIQLKFDSNTSVTRATQSDFGKSTDDEYEMGPSGNIAIFFKKNENTNENELFGIYNLESKKKENGTSDYEDAEYLYIQQLPATDDDIVYPTSCLVVLNGNETITSKLKQYEETNKSKTVKAEDILKEIWVADPEPKDIGYSDKEQHRYFTMTNSVYYNANTLYTPTEFEAKRHIFQTIDSAKAFPIIVHAERLLAKFTLDEKVGNGTYAENVEGKKHTYTIKDNNTVVYCEDFTEGTGNEEDVKSHAPKHIEKKYQVKLTGWGMNALETQTQLFKKIQNKEYYEGWNDPDYYRSYWSEDPHYDYEADGRTPLKYPWQYRLAVNNPLDFYKTKENETAPDKINYLKNYNFTVLNNDEFEKVVYTPENTYDPSIYNGMKENFDSRTELLAGTHLIVGAELLTNFDEDGTFEAKDVYRDRKGVFYKNQKDCFWALVRAFNFDMQSNTQMKFRLYNWTANKGDYGKKREALTMQNDHYFYYGTAETWDNAVKAAMAQKTADEANKDYSKGYVNKLPQITGTTKNVGTYHLYHKVGNDCIKVTYDYIMGLPDNTPFFIPATVKDGDGKVLPWLDGLTIMSEDENGYTNPLNIYDEINIRYSYLDGEPVVVGTRPYAPTDDDMKSLILEWMGAVDHFNEGKMYYAAPVKHNAANVTGNSDKADQSKLANYGVVRNNWYKFKLNDIIGIGTSVDNPSEPIVPNEVKTNDQLNLSVDILPWHQLDTTAPVL